MNAVAAELTNTTTNIVGHMLPPWLIDSTAFTFFLQSMVISALMSILATVGSLGYLAWVAVKSRLWIVVEVNENTDIYDWVENALQTSTQFQSNAVTHAHLQVDQAKVRERTKQELIVKKQDDRSTPLIWKPLEANKYWLYCHNTCIWITKEKYTIDSFTIYKFKLECFGLSKDFIKNVVIPEFEKQYNIANRQIRYVDFYRLSIEHNLTAKWSHVTTKQVRSLDSVIIPDSQSTKIINDMRRFLANEDWYLARGIPYRRGYLFYGPPGTGKSSFVQAIAGELWLPIYIINLGIPKMTDQLLTERLSDITRDGIILLEDVDAAFGSSCTDVDNGDARVGAAELSKGITFSGLLNALDGVAAQEGKILIMTTNHIERLDQALIRPGRVDLRYRFDLVNRTMAKQLFTQFYDDEQFAETFATAVPEETYSIAELQGHLLQYQSDPQKAIKNFPKFLSKKIKLL